MRVDYRHLGIHHSCVMIGERRSISILRLWWSWRVTSCFVLLALPLVTIARIVPLSFNGERIVGHTLFPSEVCNVFWKYKHVGGLSEEQVVSYVTETVSLVDEYHPVDDFLNEALVEAVRLDHSVYDMPYFALARRNAATLFILDRKPQKLCLEHGVSYVTLDNEF